MITFVVAIGDPFNGLTLYGPFASEDKALDWAESMHETEINIVQVQAPFTHENEATA